MTTCEFFLVDAFTQVRGAGNPAGVILHDGTLTGAQMQALAGELGRESAFLTPTDGEGADYQVAYYTGAQRIPLCGHDTIAAATVLALTGRMPTLGRVRFATDVGVVPVEVREDGTAWMTQALPQFGPPVPAADAARALSMDAAEVIGVPQVVSTGTPFLFVPLRERAVLDALAPDMTLLAASTKGVGAFGAYLWTPPPGDRQTEALAYARCFAPGAGLPEDPVTGSASGALGAYLLHHHLAQPDAGGVFAFSTEQGYALGRPGGAQVRVETQEGQVTGVHVGGHAVRVAEGRLWV